MSLSESIFDRTYIFKSKNKSGKKLFNLSFFTIIKNAIKYPHKTTTFYDENNKRKIKILVLYFSLIKSIRSCFNNDDIITNIKRINLYNDIIIIITRKNIIKYSLFF